MNETDFAAGSGNNPADRQVGEKALGKALQNARKKAGLTQQQLCYKTGLSYSTLAKIERGAIKAPSIFTIQSIAAAVGSSLDDLVGAFAPALPSAKPKAVSKSGIRFVYFDINGCLVRFFHRAFSKLAEDTGASPDIIETTFWHYNDAVCKGEMSMEEFNSTLSKRLGGNKIDWNQYYLEAVDAVPEMEELVTWASENYHVGLLSNIMPGLIDAMMTSGLIPKLNYDAIIDSSEVGSIKPEPHIYEVATEKSGVKPNEILLVDDSRSNLMAAEKFGWHVLWFDDFHSGDSAKNVRSALEPA